MEELLSKLTLDEILDFKKRVEERAKKMFMDHIEKNTGIRIPTYIGYVNDDFTVPTVEYRKDRDRDSKDPLYILRIWLHPTTENNYLDPGYIDMVFNMIKGTVLIYASLEVREYFEDEYQLNKEMTFKEYLKNPLKLKEI